MTISTPANKVTWLGNGSTSVFSYNFPIPNAAAVTVIYTDATGNQTTLNPAQYTITGLGQPTAGGGPQGGTVTYPLNGGAPIASGTTLTLLRVVPYTQATLFANQSGVWPTVVESSEDTIVEQTQQLAELFGRGITINPADTSPATPLPPAAFRSNKVLAFDSNGNPICITNGAPTGDVTATTVLVPSSNTARSLGGRFGEIFDVKDYGATGGGSVDDTQAIQDAIDAALPANGHVYFPAGTYLVSSTLLAVSAGANVAFCGAGRYLSTIKTTFATGQVLKLQATYAEVAALQFTSSATRTADPFVYTNCIESFIHDCEFDANFIGILGQDIVGCFQNLSFKNPATNAIGIQVNGYAGGLVMDSCIWFQPTNSPAAGINIVNAGGVLMSNLNIIGQGFDLNINPTTGQAVGAIFATNCFFDTAVAGIVINPSGNANVVRCRFDSCWTCSHTQDGVIIENSGTGVVAGIHFIDHMSCFNHAGGLNVVASASFPTDTSVIGGFFCGNTGFGIGFGVGVTDFTVMGATAGQGAGTIGNGTYGILVSTGASDHYVITGNRVRGNTSGGVSDGGSGSNKYVAGNVL